MHNVIHYRKISEARSVVIVQLKPETSGKERQELYCILVEYDGITYVPSTPFTIPSFALFRDCLASENDLDNDTIGDFP